MADYDYVQSTGVILPDTSTLQADVEGEYRAALGQDLIVDPSTPQGAMITAEVIARSGVLGNNAALANQINPNLAGGVFLDAIWALTGGQRIAATRTVVSGALLGGLPNLLIPAGSQASLADGTLFESVSDVTLDGMGNGAVDFQAVDVGPIAVNIGALNEIATGILGWDTVTNPVAGVLGRDQESDYAARQRRKLTLSAQNVALAEAIVSGLYNDTPNVRSLAFRENVNDFPITIEGVTLVPHSIYVCVDGGTDAAVATTLLENKSGGCAWNGSTSVPTVEPASGQVYDVRFDRPTVIEIAVRITIRNPSGVLDPVTSVKKSTMDYANGLLDGEAGLVVGGDVSPFEIGGAVSRELPSLYVQKAEVALVPGLVWSTDEIPVTISQKARLLEGNIQVIVV